MLQAVKKLPLTCRRGGLDRFFPPGDPYLQQVADKAFALKNDPKNLLNTPRQIDHLAKLALYQPILYCGTYQTPIIDARKAKKMMH